MFCFTKHCASHSSASLTGEKINRINVNPVKFPPIIVDGKDNMFC